MGGNVFKDQQGNVLTRSIDKDDVLPTVKWLEKITDLKLVDNLLGTAGKKATSGDIDIAVDANIEDKSQLAKKLAAYVEKQKENPTDCVKKSGISVHFKAPIRGNPKNGHVQIDFMFGEPEWMKWSMQGGKANSELKGSHRHIILASIAKHRGMKWSWQKGLVNRDTNEVISRDPNDIAKKILGQTATAKQLADPEAIIDFVIKLPDYEQMIADARETLDKDGVSLPNRNTVENYTPGTGAWFRKMIEVIK